MLPLSSPRLVVNSPDPCRPAQTAGRSGRSSCWPSGSTGSWASASSSSPPRSRRRAPGLGAVAVFALTGLALLPAALTFATLGRRFDEDGGPVVFARAAFGDRVSFLVGWVAYVSALFSTAAVTVGLTRATLPALGVDGGLAARVAPALLVTLPRRGRGLRPSPLRPRLDEPHRPQAPAPRPAGGRLRPRLGALPRARRGGAGLRLASSRAHGRLRLPGLRDRAGDRRPGPLLVPRRPGRHRGLARPRRRPVRGPGPGVRDRAARPRVVGGAARGDGRGGLGTGPRAGSSPSAPASRRSASRSG